MDNSWAGLVNVFGWVARASTYAIAAILIIFLVQLLARRLLPARWSYALWLILLLRMVLPAGPESRLSLWNFVPQWTRWASPDQSVPENGKSNTALPGQSGPLLQILKTGRMSPSPSGQELTNKEEHTIRPQAGKKDSKIISLLQEFRYMAPLIWLAGALGLMLGITISNLRLWRSVRRLRQVTEQPMLELLEDCKQQMHVRTVVGLAVTNRVKSPSLFGFIRPRILLPEGLTRHLPPEELRYIFLHELAHLKCGDIWIGWVVALLQSLHWFNPLVWWAFIRVRADRELACDAMVLSTMQGEECRPYGGAIVNLLERFNHSQPLPAIAGILENKVQLKRRLIMIAEFRRPTRMAGVLAAALLVILSGGLLTDAKENSIPSTAPEEIAQAIQVPQAEE